MASRRALLIGSLRSLRARVLVLALALVAGIGATACTPPSAHAAKPALVPSMRVRTLDASETDLAVALQGHPALVSLWATWCDACKKEMPALDRVHAWAKEHGASVVGVAVGESLSKVSSFASASHLSYPVLVDEEFHLADALGEKRVPATLVVDRTGRIVEVGGSLDEHLIDVFRKLVDSENVHVTGELGPPPAAQHPAAP